jgi:hypothetical protein
MANPLPTELVREFGAFPLTQSQLRAIGSTAPTASAFLEALDWMMAIIWPFAYDETFQLGAIEAPSEVNRRTRTLRELSETYRARDAAGRPDLLAAQVAAAADTLDENTDRLLSFEVQAMQLAGRGFNTLSIELRPNLITEFWSTVNRAGLEAAGTVATARMLRVTLDRIRQGLGRSVSIELPRTPDDWATQMFR